MVLILEAALAIWVGFGIRPRRYLNFVGQVPKFSDVSVCKATKMSKRRSGENYISDRCGIARSIRSYATSIQPSGGLTSHGIDVMVCVGMLPAALPVNVLCIYYYIIITRDHADGAGLSETATGIIDTRFCGYVAALSLGKFYGGIELNPRIS